MKRLIFIFLDGVGIGKPSESNPFFHSAFEFLPLYEGNSGLPDNTPVKPIDACLGVEGIPQSASGQTTLYTGENIPRLLNYHKDSYPNREMRKLLKEKNILTELKKNRQKAVFINAYPMYSRFFTAEHIRINSEGEIQFSRIFPQEFKRRISVTTCMMTIARQTPFNEKDILNERAVFQEYSNRWLIEKGLELPEFSPEKAAEILHRALSDYNFILYEFFQTDIYGHRRSFEDQIHLINGINRLLGELIQLLNPQEETLLVTSDHGNLEDSTTRSHTKNPVPLIVWGKDAQQLRHSIDQITDITPGILNYFATKDSSLS